VRTKLAVLFLAVPLAACGVRSDRVFSRPAAAPTQAPVAVETEHPTGDPALKGGGLVIGKAPPEIHASEWVNSGDPLSLRDLNGRPVLISFCSLDAPKCAEGRAVLKELHAQHAKWGFTVIELFVDQPSGHTSSHAHFQHMRSTITAMNLPYAAGFGERVAYTQLRYGFHELPAAYLVDSDGKLVWSGSPKQHEASLRAAAETIAGRAPI